ncbi:MAG: single-stranded-DNA-specific exonuclease RecJ [Merismopedia sp. SIO2A8]|nr:single-stranded-DNA-specific exonuclease RecJ [Merismopedia sp. SIO2A8]
MGLSKEQATQTVPIGCIDLSVPPDFVKTVHDLVVELFPQQRHRSGRYLAQLLWQRGWRDRAYLSGFLDPNHYVPTSAFAFGDEMQWAIARLQRAYEQQEQITIWGDFDADGLTATAVLWDGLGQFFPHHQQLRYWIPNRLTESHGLNQAGLTQLAQEGCDLIVTCDTGSTNLEELAYAQTLGIDVIVTDHHTLAPERPEVVALINPRMLPPDHPLANVSGVAVAYKLVEALYETLPHVPRRSLDHLLDLVAIGLITDLVELTGDCRYLAQRGIQSLQTLLKQDKPSRPGIAQLLKLCKRTGDRPTDISFGIGPRINAISRIHGDASFAIELLTSQDSDRCRQLAEQTELANSRRKALQKDVVAQVTTRLAELDLSTTQVIVLADSQWSIGVLGLVAGQVAQDYHRPTILLATASEQLQNPSSSGTVAQSASQDPPLLAKGSARSAHNINLYELVQSQSHLLHRFGGHPFAAGLSLPIENIALFRDAINRECLARYGDLASQSVASAADLKVTVAELGQGLFRELKLLEPCGMGNPVPRFLIQQCEFKERSHRNIKDSKGKKLRYIKTEFLICDVSCPNGFPGVWWGHHHDELPNEPCNAIVELDFNSYVAGGRYEVRLLELKPPSTISPTPEFSPTQPSLTLLDQRHVPLPLSSRLSPTENTPTLDHCPHTWAELEQWVHASLDSQSMASGQPLAIAFSLPIPSPPATIWRHLVGVAKYLGRTATFISCAELSQHLGIGDRPLRFGLLALEAVGFVLEESEHGLMIGLRTTEEVETVGSAIADIGWAEKLKPDDDAFESTKKAEATDNVPEEKALKKCVQSTAINALPAIQVFLSSIKEEQFQQQYFAQAPVEVLADNLKT